MRYRPYQIVNIIIVSPRAVSPINGSGPSTPRSSTSTPRETPGHPGLSSSASNGAEAGDTSAQTPARLDYFGAAKPAAIKTPGHSAEGHDSESPKTSPYNELNVGIGAKSADLLTFIAKKERKCMDLREELKRNEEELATLKKKWEAIIQREMMSAAAAADPSTTAARSESSSPQQSTHAPSSAGGLFSSITASLSASTSSSTSSGTTASPSPSSRPSSASAANRRLLTSRHSISISPTASRSPKLGSDSYFGGANLSLQESPTDHVAAVSPGSASQANYDVSKVAKSWLGGVMKHASSVLETLAPPPSATSANDLGTVREEEEPEESDEETSGPRHRHTEDNRRISTATEATLSSTTSSNSPSSSYDENEEDGRFSSTATSRSSSISSMDSHDDSLHLSKSEESVETLTDASKQHKQGDDITPVSTPLLPDTTPRAGKSPNTEVDDLWGLDGFEDSSARENREKLEQARIDEVHTSPPKDRTAVEATKPSHGRRRSTAFELGGAWGSMMGKKWSEVANSETFKTSKRATMNFVDTFEKTLGDALFEAPNAKKASPDANQGSMMYLNGEYVPSSVAESPSPSERERSLPSGIGSAGAWSTLLGRSKTTPKNKDEQWGAQSPTGDLGETSMSPSSSAARSPGGTRKARIALNDNPLEEDDESFDSFSSASPVQPVTSRSALTKTMQPRHSATRTKHSKRMSLPSNLLVGEPRRPASSAFGLGLENVSEEDKAETEDAWGW